MKKIIILSVALSTVLSGCNFNGKLTRRYKSMSLISSNDEVKGTVEVNAYTLEKDKPAPTTKTIFDLSPKAQAALIAEVAKKETTTDPFIAGLIKSLLAKTPNNSEILDYSQIERKVVVSIRNKGHWPADRISKINVGIDLGTVSEMKLVSCSRLTTEYQSLDIGKLNYSNTQSGELGAKVTGGVNVEAGIEQGGVTAAAKPSLNGELNGKLTASRSFAEEVLLKQRMVALNAAIQANKLTLYQEGVSGIDLTGNIIADVKFAVSDLNVAKVYSFGDIRIANGAANDADKLKVNEKVIVYPNLTSDVSATLSFEADYRHVTKGDKTISEADDKVQIFYGEHTDTNPTILIPKEQLVPKLYVLSFSDVKGKMPIQIKSPIGSGFGDMVFNSISDAKDFANWLREKYTSTLKIGAEKYELEMPAGFTSISKIEVVAQ